MGGKNEKDQQFQGRFWATDKGFQEVGRIPPLVVHIKLDRHTPKDDK